MKNKLRKPKTRYSRERKKGREKKGNIDLECDRSQPNLSAVQREILCTASFISSRNTLRKFSENDSRNRFHTELQYNISRITRSCASGTQNYTQTASLGSQHYFSRYWFLWLLLSLHPPHSINIFDRYCFWSSLHITTCTYTYYSSRMAE